MKIAQKETESVAGIPNSTDSRWEGHMSDGVGATYGPKPLAFLNANSDELLLSGNRGTFRLPRASVLKLGRGSMYPWCFGGIRIRHNISNFPADLQFKPMGARSRDILDRLRALGYPAA